MTAKDRVRLAAIVLYGHRVGEAAIVLGWRAPPGGGRMRWGWWAQWPSGRCTYVARTAESAEVRAGIESGQLRSGGSW